MEAEAVVNTIYHSLTEAEAERHVDALRDVQSKASDETLADRVGRM